MSDYADRIRLAKEIEAALKGVREDIARYLLWGRRVGKSEMSTDAMLDEFDPPRFPSDALLALIEPRKTVTPLPSGWTVTTVW